MNRLNPVKFVTILSLLSMLSYADSFFDLKNVKTYTPLVVNNIPKATAFTAPLKKMIFETSKELGVKTPKHLSRVLVFVLREFSVGETSAIKMDLELGEYVKREGLTAPIFAITYEDTRMFTPEDLEEDIMDNADSLLEKFSENYRDDNKVIKALKQIERHEGFAAVMGYETSYASALKKAQKAHKPLLVFMTTNYCPWCRKMEKNILSQREVAQKVSQGYIPVMLNLEIEDFPKTLSKIKLTPTLYIVDEKNESITSTFVGYSARDEFIHTLGVKSEH